MKITQRNTKEFLIADGNGRRATIVFTDRTFTFCKFNALKMPYDLEDWGFIEDIAKFIREANGGEYAKQS